MRAEVRSTEVQDVVPDEGSVTIRFHLGPADGPGEESFDVTVCTPQWLAREVEREGRPVIGRHLLVVDHIDEARDIAYLTATFQQFRAETWAELGEKLARIGYWEFEDYTPYQQGPM